MIDNADLSDGLPEDLYGFLRVLGYCEPYGDVVHLFALRARSSISRIQADFKQFATDWPLASWSEICAP